MAAWKGVIPEEVLREANKRLEQEQQIGYLDPYKSGVLSYLELSELKDLILGGLWTCYKDHWPLREIVKSEFRKLVAIRNKIAHFRPLTSRDFRVAHRFAEDLAEWSRHYRRIREYQKTVSNNEKYSEEFFKAEQLSILGQFWEQVVSEKQVSTNDIALTLVGHHVALTLAVPGGSINAERFLKFVDQNESKVSFCRIGTLGDKLCCYIPKDIQEETIVDVFKKMIEVAATPTEGLSSDQILSEFELAERESLLTWEVELPADFQN